MAFNIVENIPAAKRSEVREAILEVCPNRNTISDPEWVDPEDGSVASQVPEFTDAEWVDEIVWAYLKKLYKKGKDNIRDRKATDLTDIRN